MSTRSQQGAFRDGHDQPGYRERGTRDLLDALAADLAHQDESAGSS